MASQIPDTSPAPRFPLGNLYATSAVAQWASQEVLSLSRFIERHHNGDWGDLDEEDKQANEDALKYGGRIFSSYLTNQRKLYVITECDRSLTTILFAEEY
jgi:hypothetical protein